MGREDGHIGRSIFLYLYLSDRDDLAREGIVLRTRERLGSGARWGVDQSLVSTDHTEDHGRDHVMDQQERSWSDGRSIAVHGGPR